MKERKVEIENVGEFVLGEMKFGLKTFFTPVSAVASAFSSAIREVDPYKLSDMKAADGASGEAATNAETRKR